MGNNMAMGIWIPLTLVISLAVIWIASVVQARWAKFQLFKKLGIPGPTPSFLFGNLMELKHSKSKKSPLEVYDEWEKKFGSIYGYYSGTGATLVIRDLKIIKEVLIKNSCEDFSTRLTPVVRAKPFMDSLVGLNGRRWKEQRSILVQAFSGSKLRQMSQSMNKSITTTIDILMDNIGKEVNVLEMFQGLSCEVISECALAMEVNCQRNKNDPFLVAVREFMLNAMNSIMFIAMCFPWIARGCQFIIDNFAISAKMTHIVCHNVQGVIKTRRNNSVLTDHEECVDILQMMLETSASTSDKSRKQSKMTDEEIIANCWIFLLGGFETTSSAMTFISYLLAMHPDVQQRLFDELQCSFSEEENVTYDHVNELTFLDQVICEALRLYPPVVTFIIRETVKPTQVGTFILPKGVRIQIPVWQIHHDKDLWPEPYKFDPNRFDPAVRQTHSPMSWIPFGAGPRNCVGRRFALLEAKLTLARLVRSFRFMVSENTVKELEFAVPTVTIVPKSKLLLKFEKR